MVRRKSIPDCSIEEVLPWLDIMGNVEILSDGSRNPDYNTPVARENFKRQEKVLKVICDAISYGRWVSMTNISVMDCEILLERLYTLDLWPQEIRGIWIRSSYTSTLIH